MDIIKKGSLKKFGKPLKIYLADLTYDTVTLASEAMPLNVGYVAAYCKKIFGDQDFLVIEPKALKLLSEKTELNWSKMEFEKFE